jgi:hypothetical protein
MSEVQERYLRFEAAADQHAGQVICDLPVKKADFATVPPYFHESNEKVTKELKFCFPCLYFIPYLQSVLFHCLASVDFHDALYFIHFPMFIFFISLL